ncbi:hypothetical protein [Pseudomonas syringae]|uniref:Uncharacterized protein n=1 Tax=Pseudomonas syringae TaxID=317 RepID=A0A085VAF4_PSESX|nr:hypothetical protein [Pseudomonas syringae]KFE52417.1 hypothetical protein IV02_08265 [Pseudomonas syringae]
MMSFDEAVTAAQENQKNAYIGFVFTPEIQWVGWFEISTVDEDEPDDNISIHHQGGVIFSSEGEDEYYRLEDVPEAARRAIYILSSTVPQMTDFTSDYVLYRLFPDLPDPETLWEKTERNSYFDTALQIAVHSGLVAVTC